MMWSAALRMPSLPVNRPSRASEARNSTLARIDDGSPLAPDWAYAPPDARASERETHTDDGCRLGHWSTLPCTRLPGRALATGTSADAARVSRDRPERLRPSPLPCASPAPDRSAGRLAAQGSPVRAAPAGDRLGRCGPDVRRQRRGPDPGDGGALPMERETRLPRRPPRRSPPSSQRPGQRDAQGDSGPSVEVRSGNQGVPGVPPSRADPRRVDLPDGGSRVRSRRTVEGAVRASPDPQGRDLYGELAIARIPARRPPVGLECP